MTLLIIGLGNPGAPYDNTRHNIGRAIAAQFQKEMGFSAFRLEKNLRAEISEGRAKKTKIIVALPNTFMNKSGSAAGAIARFFRVGGGHCFVLHDDADIVLGRAKLSFGRGAAGHQGVESMIRALKTKNFWRFRIGIAGKRNIPADKLVLKKFNPEETRAIKKVIKRTIAALKQAIEESPQRAMNEYNR